jgi:AcrR family transcriptional regulator
MGEPPGRDFSEPNEEIMRATYRALREHGYADLTVKRIADEYGKSTAAVHYYYDTKEELLAAFLDYLLERFVASMREVETTDPEQRLDLLLDELLDAPQENQDLSVALLEMRSQAPYKEAFRERFRQNDEYVRFMLKAVVNHGIDEGAFREDADADEVARSLMTIVDGARTRVVVLGDTTALETARRTAEELAPVVVVVVVAASDVGRRHRVDVRQLGRTPVTEVEVGVDLPSTVRTPREPVLGGGRRAREGVPGAGEQVGVEGAEAPDGEDGRERHEVDVAAATDAGRLDGRRVDEQVAHGEQGGQPAGGAAPPPQVEVSEPRGEHAEQRREPGALPRQRSVHAPTYWTVSHKPSHRSGVSSRRCRRPRPPALGPASHSPCARRLPGPAWRPPFGGRLCGAFLLARPEPAGVSLDRRRLLQSALLVALPPVAGCSRPNRSEPVELRMVRVVNLAEREVSVELTATPAGDGADAHTLYAGPVGTQAGDAGAGEVVVRPDETEREPLRFDYRLSVAGGGSARLSGRALEAGRESASGDAGCVELEFVVRSVGETSEVWGDYEFWADCETAPGTVVPSTDS